MKLYARLNGRYESFIVVDADGHPQCNPADGRDHSYQTEVQARAAITNEELNLGFNVAFVKISGAEIK